MNPQITFITNSVGLRAVLISARIPRAALDQLYAIGGQGFRMSPKLTSKLGLWAVLTYADYERHINEDHGRLPALGDGLTVTPISI